MKELGPKIVPLARVRPELTAIPGGMRIGSLVDEADVLRRKEPLGSTTGNKSTLNATCLRFLTEEALTRKSAWTDEPDQTEISPPEAVEERALF